MKASELDLILEAYRELYPETNLKDVRMFFDELPLVEGRELFVLRVYKSYCKHIFVCGSNAHTLSKEMKSELRGWPLEFETWPLSFAEFCDFRGVDRKSSLEAKRAKVRIAFDDFNRMGGMPAVALTDSRSLQYKRLQGYFDTMLLKDFIEKEKTRKKVSIQEIQLAVAKKYSISLSQILSKEKTANLVTPRQLAMYIARKFTSKSLPVIAGEFDKTHATILHGVKTIEKRLDVEDDLKNMLAEILSEFGYTTSDKLD
mgnify:CR=1 FL=1